MHPTLRPAPPPSLLRKMFGVCARLAVAAVVMGTAASSAQSALLGSFSSLGMGAPSGGSSWTSVGSGVTSATARATAAFSR